jgi:hemerythrin-like domain-containing protein
MLTNNFLLNEHRLIERMIAVMKIKLAQIETRKYVDPLMIDAFADFIHMYADRTHHGKEENVMFKKLAERPLSAQAKQTMDELVDEHVQGRNTTMELVEANNRYRTGDLSALSVIVEKLMTLADFYTKHIEKEDIVFFPSVKEYFSKQEDLTMIEEFYEFDRQLIHEKYESVVSDMEK